MSFSNQAQALLFFYSLETSLPNESKPFPTKCLPGHQTQLHSQISEKLTARGDSSSNWRRSCSTIWIEISSVYPGGEHGNTLQLLISTLLVWL